MSINAPNWYTIQYDQKVNHLLQSEGFLLRGTTQAPVNVVGNTLQFFFIGRGEATEMSQAIEMITPANLDKTTKDVTMKDYQFAEFIRHGEVERISVEFKSAIQEAGSMALGRKFDRVILQAMDNEDTAIDTIGDGSAAISPIDVSTGKAEINALGMMKMNEFYLPVPSMSWEQLKLYKVFNNSDYTGPDLNFKNGVEAKTWNGVHFFQLPDEAFTSPSAGVVDTYLWNKRTVGFGSNYAIKTNITYENLFTAWLYNSTMSGAAKVLQTEGVKRLRIKINDPLTIDGGA
ncbi:MULTISPECIES: phage capsid protein [Rhodopseudomonas]|uniref:Major capsid protein n=1 Tax=Rhodopseudomonas palustris TaxID=1076 RepID=A0A0D7F6Q0_RHOPL|nr:MULTISPECIES: phage capsid protein [Rhodopseudomonas]KIZ47392.1 hypothetical protein OO17_04600 [Rhodopseudomonas palustris]MDF3809264.1 phage capsid protein [Rhodopseudomonas sp. BAL398]WOK19051.1 phage capsid protein [Rhodopseudomonas sp. BAL398]